MQSKQWSPENHHFLNSIVVTDWDKSHQWILKQVGEILTGKTIFS